MPEMELKPNILLEVLTETAESAGLSFAMLTLVEVDCWKYRIESAVLTNKTVLNLQHETKFNPPRRFTTLVSDETAKKLVKENKVYGETCYCGNLRFQCDCQWSD